MRVAGIRTLVLACVLAAAGAWPATADVRTIATIALDTWFDGGFHTLVEDVTLIGLRPGLSLEARVAREDVAGWHGWRAGLGPVVNLTERMYVVALYDLGVDSDAVFSHQLDASLNHETADTAASLGLKATWFPSTGYFYVIPSLGGKFHPVAALGLFGKVFLAVDADGNLSGSFWGEADWRVIPAVAVRGGGTLGWSGQLGWSAIAGVNVVITPNVLLKYTFKYLAEPLDGTPGQPVQHGVQNGIVLDVRF